MLTDQCIVCLAGEDWWYHPMRSRRQLMTRLARAGNRVLFVNSIGSRVPRVRRGNFLGKLARKARSWMRGLQRVEERLSVFSPIAIPGAGRGFLQKINVRFLLWQIRRAMRRCGIQNPILWVGLPSFAPLIGKLGERLVVFHASDRFDAYAHVRENEVRSALEMCIQSADVVVAVSEPLREMAERLNPKARVRIVTHGVDLEHFVQARRKDFAEAEALRDIPRPRLGYVGTLEQFQDPELIARIARKHPEWHLVFVGPDHEDLQELRELANIHFLPACAYEEVPRYLAGFDVCLIPRKMDAWVTHSNPLKFKEYLAAGREVVATDIPALRPYGEYVWLAGSREAFVEACEAVLLRGESRVKGLDPTLLQSESWEAKTKEVSHLLTEALKPKRD